MPIGLGLIHVKGNICKYESVASGNRRQMALAGRRVKCRKAGKRGYVVDTRHGSPDIDRNRRGAAKRRGSGKMTATRRKGGSAKRKSTTPRRSGGRAPSLKGLKCKNVTFRSSKGKRYCRKLCWKPVFGLVHGGGRIVHNRSCR